MKAYSNWGVATMALTLIGMMSGCSPNAGSSSSADLNKATRIANSIQNSTLVNPGGTSYAFVVTFQGRVYFVTGTYEAHAGKQIGTITAYVRGANVPMTVTASNAVPVGTKIYEIPGKSVKKAIAISGSQGYEEALNDPSN